MYRYQIAAGSPSDSPYIEFPKTLHIDFFNDSMVKESQVDAKYGKYREWENKVFLKDSVVVINVLKGDTLRCEELWWDQTKELIYTDVPVHIRKPDEKIDGSGLVADQNFSHWTIRNAKGPVSVPDSTLPAN